MRIRATVGFIKARREVKPGDVLDLPDSEAMYLIQQGRAVLADEPERAVLPQNRDPISTNRDPRPSRSRRDAQ